MNRPHFKVSTCQPGSGEHALQALDLDVGHHPVQGLPVQVDDPQQLTQRCDLRVGYGFPDCPLVKLGVTEQTDEPAGSGCRREMRGDVAVRHGRPQRRGGADADRTGGEVDGVGILQPARVALQPALARNEVR